MTTIGNIGIGLFVLIIVWILALIVFVVGVKFQSNIAWIALGTAAALTAVFLIIPTEKPDQIVDESDIEATDKDYLIIYKKILFTFIVISSLIGFLSFFLLYCIKPIRARPIKDFTS